MIAPEALAEMIYANQERLAPTFGFRTQTDALAWSDVPPRNRAFMVATADAVLHELVGEHRVADPRRATAGW